MPPQIDVQRPSKSAGNPVSIWSIGIFAGPTLRELKPCTEDQMPVLSAKDVTDIPAEFVADPFMIQANDAWFMFFEVMNAETRKGEIGLATSRDGLNWEYQQIVLSAPFHLSYPYVFCHGGEYFMIPESYEANSMRLYRADPFPLKWSYVRTLMDGPWVDSSIFFFDRHWWIFSNPVAPAHQVLELFYASDLGGSWTRHPKSPLITGNNRIARSAGRVIASGNMPIRFTQECFPSYGTRVRAFEITRLTTSEYGELEMRGSPILSGGEQSWRESGMHHIDPHYINKSWLACVDGWRYGPRGGADV
jgi:hypothetical protein